MSACERMNLLSTILKQSAVNRRADGLRSVILAEQVAKDLDGGAQPSVDRSYTGLAMAKALTPSKSQATCHTMDTSNSAACTQKQICYEAKRREVALYGAETNLNSADNIKDLYLTAKGSGDLTLTKAWAAQLKQLGDLGAPGLRDWLNTVGGAH